MNKYIVIVFLGVLTVVLAESALKRDRDTLIKGWTYAGVITYCLACTCF